MTSTARPPRIVGIDPSLTSTGIAVIDAARGITTDRVRSKGAKTATLAERSRRLHALAEQILDACDGADLVVIESPAYSNSLGSMHDRSGLWWLIVDGLRQMAAPVLEVPPTTRAKYATGRGNAGKDEVLAAVIRRHPTVDVTGNDIADALTLAAIGARLTGWPLEPTIPTASTAALAKLQLPKACPHGSATQPEEVDEITHHVQPRLERGSGIGVDDGQEKEEYGAEEVHGGIEPRHTCLGRVLPNDGANVRGGVRARGAVSA